MEYLNQIPVPSTLQIVIAIATLWYILSYLVAKRLSPKEGIFPKFWRLMGRLSDQFSETMEVVGHAYFGVIEENVAEFFANERSLRSIAKLLKVAAVFIMVITFYASFNSITEFFVGLGFAQNVAVTLAIANDAFIGLSVIYRLYHSFKGESSMWGSISLFFFTALSFYFNIRHIFVDNTAGYWDLVSGGGLAPLGLFVSVEFLSSVIKSQTYREGAVRTDQELGAIVTAKRQERDSLETEVRLQTKMLENLDTEIKAKTEVLEAEINSLIVTRDDLNGDLEHLNRVIAQLDEQFTDRVPNSQGRLDQVTSLLEAGHNTDEIAETMGINPRTANSYVRSVKAINGKA